MKISIREFDLIEHQPKPLDISIVMPCLNEVQCLSHCIANAREALARIAADYGLVGEIVIADNGSTDGSQVLAESLGARVVTVSAKGYGAALIGGCQAAFGRYILMGDADGSYDFTDGVAMIGRLIDGADLCMGSRFKGGIAHHQIAAIGLVETADQRRAVALARHVDHAGAKAAGQLLAAVGRAVVGDDDLAGEAVDPFDPGQRLARVGDAMGEGLDLVEAGHDDGNRQLERAFVLRERRGEFHVVSPPVKSRRSSLKQNGEQMLSARRRKQARARPWAG